MNDTPMAPVDKPDRVADARMFIARAYRALLNRAADPVGLQSYVDLLLAGEMDQAEIVSRLVGSDEFAAGWLSGLPDATSAFVLAEQTVIRIFGAILRRLPDPVACELYANALTLGLITEGDLVAELIASEEYRHGETTASLSQTAGSAFTDADAQIVIGQAYLIHLERLPDPVGLASHAARLRGGHATIQELIDEIRSSPEGEALRNSQAAAAANATSEPKNGIARGDAEFIVNQAYLTFLGRQPDAGGFAAHVSRLVAADVTIEQLFAEFEHSPERYARQQQQELLVRRDGKALALSSRYAAAPEEWDAYLAALVDAVQHQKRQRRAPRLHRLHLVVENDVGEQGEWLTTLRSFDALAIDEATVLSASIAPGQGLSGDPASFGDRQPFARLAVLPGIPGAEKLGNNDLVFWVKAGDTFHPSFLELVTANLGKADLLTVDGWFSEEGYIFPVLHPGANPALALNSRLAYSRMGCRGSMIAALAGETIAFGKDLLQEELCRPGRVTAWTHVALPLLGLAIRQADIVATQQEMAAGPRRYRSRQSAGSAPTGRITVVICTKNKSHLLDQLVTGLLTTAADRLADVIIVSNNTTSFLAEQAFDRLKAMSSLVQVVRYDNAFNFSAQSNLGARLGSGDYLLMLNDDIVPIRDGWLDELLAPFEDADVGIVGPLLLYPDERVQHAGMFLGYSGSAGHALRSARLPDEDYLFTANAPRDVTVVTGAVMMLSRHAFDMLNGFDELLASYLQDVDICLRAYHAGFRVVFTPFAQLLHMESASVIELLVDARVQANRGREHAYFSKRWAALGQDDFHNNLFDPADESMRTLRLPV